MGGVESPVDIHALVVVGLINKFPEIHKAIAKTIGEEGSLFKISEILSIMKKAIQRDTEYSCDVIDVKPFDKSTCEKLTDANLFIQQIFARQRLVETMDARFMPLMGNDILAEIETSQQPRTPPTYHPANISKEEIKALKSFEGLTFAVEAQQNILSICKAVKIPVTPNSFKTLRIKVDGEPKPALGIDISESQYEALNTQLILAGIGDYCKKAKATESGRQMVAIDIGALDNSFEALTKLSTYRQKVMDSTARRMGQM